MWVVLMYTWVRQYPIIDACEEAGLGEHTAIDMYQWLQEVCSQALLNGPPIIIGRSAGSGPNSMFWKSKIKHDCLITLQHHCGRATRTEVWVFGLVDTSTLRYVEVVQKQDALTLLPIIAAHTAPGTFIFMQHIGESKLFQMLLYIVW